MSIYGNSYLITVAWVSDSPTQACRVAATLGCSKEQIKGIREAAKIKRDEGEDVFLEKYSPFTVMDIPTESYDSLTFGIKLVKLGEASNLNAVEVNKLLKHIEKELAHFGITVNYSLKPVHPIIKSRF